MSQFSWLWIFICGLVVSTSANAASGGGYSLGIHLGLTSSSQTQMNELIKRANARATISTGELNSAYEGAASFTYRFSGTVFAFQLRPSFFYQKQSGTGTGGSFDYGLTGFTVFPILRLYPLENNFMKFYMQFGLGYGRLNGKITEASASVDFAGGAFGSLTGMGAEFCFGGGSHCLSLEGNYRYMTVERMLAGNVTGSFSAAPNASLSQAIKGQEVEFDDADLNANLGGLMFVAGYQFWF